MAHRAADDFEFIRTRLKQIRVEEGRDPDADAIAQKQAVVETTATAIVDEYG